jgi:hypothetical protein
MIAIGIAFLAIGIATSKSVFTILGIVFLSIGISTRRKRKAPGAPRSGAGD